MSGRDRFETWAALAPVQVGTLLALAEDGTALVLDPARPEAPARPARVAVDLHAGHVGAEVVLVFEGGDPGRPIVLGVLQSGMQRPEALPVEADVGRHSR